MDNIDNAIYLYTLTQLKGIKSHNIFDIIGVFETLNSFVNSSDSSYPRLKGIWSDKSIEDLRTEFCNLLPKSQKVIEKQLNDSVSITTILDEDYPRLLKKIANPPILLYFKGNISILNNLNCVAIIGTRNATPNGIKNARIIAQEFAKRKFVVVSGLAKGIDTAAHNGALEEGYTAAVLGTPLNKIYPAENKPLVQKIISNNGVILSELANGQSSFRGNFVQRDRIQSGLSLGVIPVQTDIEGGTMHTVNFATQQKRIIFCPKPPENEAFFKQYSGIVKLINENKAKEFRYEQIQQIVSEMEDLRSYLNNELNNNQSNYPTESIKSSQKKKKNEVNKLNIPLFNDNLDQNKLDKIAESIHQAGYDLDPIVFEQVMNQLRRKFFTNKRDS